MFKKVYHIIIVLFLLCAFCQAFENPNVGSPFQRRNAPTHSGQQQRFITSGNPYGRSSNDIVTGNVGGGKHFRGVVPYGSSYYSNVSTGSASSQSVNRFIRRSADPIANDRNPGRPGSYYDPRRSVSALRRPDGASGLTNPHLTGQGRTNPYVIPSPTTALTTPRHQRPLSTNTMDLEQILARQEQLRKEGLDKDDQIEAESTKQKNFFEYTLDADLIKSKIDAEKQDAESPDLSQYELQDQQQPDNQLLDDELAADTMADEQDESALPDAISPRSKFLPNLDEESFDAAEGRQVLGEHETFASLAQEKFSNFMDAAEKFMNDGKFYKAADSYSLASIWRPKDARGYLGQSFALFAAGEYMSSAYYLNRAFELGPQLAAKKYNVAAFVGKRDIFENRVLEATTWQERSGSGELAFLLAYILHQDEKTGQAATFIRKAKDRMPDAAGVMQMKDIIDPEPTSN